MFTNKKSTYRSKLYLGIKNICKHLPLDLNIMTFFFFLSYFYLSDSTGVKTCQTNVESENSARPQLLNQIELDQIKAVQVLARAGMYRTSSTRRLCSSVATLS